MAGKRTKHHGLGMSRLYVYVGKRTTTYFTIDRSGKYTNLGHDMLAAKRKLLDSESGAAVFPGTTTVQLLLEEYRQQFAAQVASGKRAARTLHDIDEYIARLVRVFGHMPVDDVTTHDCWHYMHVYRAAAPKRANKEIGLLQAAYNHGLNAGVVKHNPVLAAKRNEEAPRDRYVTDAELDSFLAHCRADGTDAGKRVAIAAELAYLTAKAQGQILRLHRKQLRPDCIEFGRRKGGAGTEVLWTPALRQVVAAAAALAGSSMFLVSTQSGTPYTSHGFKALWFRRMQTWVAAGNTGFTFHDLRAKAVTDMKAQGRQASELSGHREEKTVATVYDRRRVRRAPAVK